jgi:hypothetical protein
MSDRGGEDKPKRTTQTRRDRLAEELRANLLRRKTQLKVRRETATKREEDRGK